MSVTDGLTWRLTFSLRAKLILFVIAGLSAVLRPRDLADVSRALLVLAVLAGISSLWSP